MNVLVVYCHPEPLSFNAALKDAAVAALQAQGHAVRVNDLHAMGFKPQADATDFPVRSFPERLVIPREQKAAHVNGTTAPDIAAEHAKLAWADAVVFQFPLWMYGLPALLKGWFDRVFSEGYVNDPPNGRFFDQGGMAGKRAMLSLTTGGKPAGFAPNGRHGPIEVILWPVHNALRFQGFDVLAPHVAYDVVRGDAASREAWLASLRGRMASLFTDPALPFHRLDEYDRTGGLKPGVVPRNGIQRN